MSGGTPPDATNPAMPHMSAGALAEQCLEAGSVPCPRELPFCAFSAGRAPSCQLCALFGCIVDRIAPRRHVTGGKQASGFAVDHDLGQASYIRSKYGEA